MFKLLNIQLIEHPFFRSIDFNFINDGEENEGPYITLIIGANGTGKSQILRIILDIFNIIASSQEQNKLIKPFEFRFKLTYLIDNKKFSVTNGFEESKYITHKPSFFVDDVNCSFKEIIIPKKFIASSSILADKFPYIQDISKSKNNRYEYLGIKSASNNAYIKNNTKKVINNLISCLIHESNIKKFESLLLNLKLNKTAKILYKPGRNYNIVISLLNTSGEISINNIFNIFKSKEDKFSSYSNRSNRFDNYKKILNNGESLSRVVYFLNRYRDYFTVKRKLSERLCLSIDFRTNNISLPGFQTINEYDIDILRLLSELEIISPDTLEISKNENNPYSLEDSSSGEYYLLTSFINILSVIEQDSIIMIDEPEISLHPNWQLKYVDFLYSTFNNYKSCHFIICTHSHLLVSDLVAKKSSILSLSRSLKSEDINCELFDYDTQGWSPENILYRIFNVSTTRNFYFEKDVKDALSMISNRSDDFQSMNKIIIRLKKFNLTSNDPLKLVIERLENYLAENGY